MSMERDKIGKGIIYLFNALSLLPRVGVVSAPAEFYYTASGCAAELPNCAASYTVQLTDSMDRPLWNMSQLPHE